MYYIHTVGYNKGKSSQYHGKYNLHTLRLQYCSCFQVEQRTFYAKFLNFGSLKYVETVQFGTGVLEKVHYAGYCEYMNN